MIEHDFAERLNFSNGIEIGPDIYELLYGMIPGSHDIERATREEDKNGTDLWVPRHGLPPVSVDLKNRSFDPMVRFKSDDACIETTSVYRGNSKPPWEDEHRYKIGWTLNEHKRTDIVLYTWPAGKGLRYWALYFPWLCAAAKKDWRDWARQYGEKPAKNKGYITLSIYPPRWLIAQAMGEIIRGRTKGI